MKYHFFTTTSRKVDNYLHNFLLSLQQDKVTALECIYALSNAQYMKGCDMTKEVSQEYVENIAKISKTNEDTIWKMYDKVFGLMTLIADGKDYSLLNEGELFASTLDSLLTNLKIDRTAINSIYNRQDDDLFMITLIENNCVKEIKKW